MIKGLKHVRTAITVFADDDVFWAPTLLASFLGPFENARVGAVGGLQTLERKPQPNCWDFLGAIYLERRKFELAATTTMDGGAGCLSGRTFAIRTGIIQNEQFVNGYRAEKWLGVLPLIAADDDNFLTRYLVNHGWEIAFQLTKEAELTTTLEDNSKFLAQCPWTTYAVYFSSFNPPAVLMDSLLGYTLYRAVEDLGSRFPMPDAVTCLLLFFLWIIFTKTVKFLGYFRRHPTDLKFLPILYAFSYFHGLIYLYSLMTLHKTGWGGGRSGIVSCDEKHVHDIPVYSPLDDIEAGVGFSELRSARCSGFDIHLLGDKMKGLTSLTPNLSRAQSPVHDLEMGEKI
ncbi:MAG: hypothetical protein Q9168_005961 [Polycauliona sp. 1 TL-2023]